MAAKASRTTKAVEKEELSEFDIEKMKTLSVTVRVLGVAPLIYNSVSQKARRELLFPKETENKRDREGRLKHDPMAEYVESVYRTRSNTGPTRLMVPATMFKKACMTAALDMPGVTKAETGRHIWVTGDISPDEVSIYGIPELKMDIVKNAGFSSVPDIRTRACLREWAAEFTINFLTPHFREKTVFHLVYVGGYVSGIGDYRQEKGAGSYGRWLVPSSAEENANWERVAAAGGRVAQEAALKSPNYYDIETEELITWFFAETVRRGREKERKEAAGSTVVQASEANGKGRKGNRVPGPANGLANGGRNRLPA